MKTSTLKTVKALSAIIVMTAFSAPALAQEPTQVDVKAPQVYTYTYTPSNYAGSIAHDLDVMQQSVLASVRADSLQSARAGLEASARELQGTARLALSTSSEGAPDQLFGRASYPFSRSYQVHL